jgi:hypothetical protein
LHLSTGSSTGGAPTTPSATGGTDDEPQGGDGPGCVTNCNEELCLWCDPEEIACAYGDDECTRCDHPAECSEDRTCDPLTRRCQRACEHNADCPDWRPLCDETRGVCVDCFLDSHCEGDDACVLGYCVDCGRQCRAPGVD